MITMFNRRELVVVSSLQQYSDIRRLLAAEGIQNRTKMGGGIGRSRGTDGFPAERYTIYVHEKDYDRGLAAIGPAVQEVAE